MGMRNGLAKRTQPAMAALAALAMIAAGCGGSDTSEAGDPVQPTAEAASEATAEPLAEPEESTEEPTAEVTEADPAPQEPTAPLPGLPDGTANLRRHADAYVGTEQVDLTWEEVAVDFEIGDQLLAAGGALITNTVDHNWVATADGRTWQTILEWDREAQLVIADDGSWVLVTPDPESAVERAADLRPAYAEWTVQRSTDAGATWTQLDLEAPVTPAGPGFDSWIDGPSVAVVGDTVVVLLVDLHEPDWSELAVTAGLATENDLVVAVGDGGPQLELRIIGPGKDERLPIDADTLGIEQALLDQASGLDGPASRAYVSVDGQPFTRLDVATEGLHVVERFDDGFRLTGFGVELTSTDGVDWQPLDSGALFITWAVDGWWTGEHFGGESVSVEQSLDGGASYEAVPSPSRNSFPQFFTLTELGAGVVFTEDGVGFNPDSEPTVIERDGYTFTFENFLLTVAGPDGAVIVEGAGLFEGPTPDELAISSFGEIFVLDLAAGEVLITITFEELFDGGGFGGIGQGWAVWSIDGATWFEDELDFEGGLIVPLGDAVVAIPVPFTFDRTIRVADAP